MIVTWSSGATSRNSCGICGAVFTDLRGAVSSQSLCQSCIYRGDWVGVKAQIRSAPIDCVIIRPQTPCASRFLNRACEFCHMFLSDILRCLESRIQAALKQTENGQ